MKTHKLGCIFLVFLVGIIFSFSVYAGDNAPPALPSEFWGQVMQEGSPAADGLAVTAEVSGVNYAQASVTGSGMYNVMLVNGDRELTYNNDRDCSIHNAVSEVCVPCVDEADCIEGPQDNSDVLIKINGIGTMPYADYVEGSS